MGTNGEQQRIGTEARGGGVMPIVHQLKTWPVFFERIYTGEKPFEIRKNDRDFQSGDTLRLSEFDNETSQYTGRVILRTITYVMQGGAFGLEAGFVCLGLKGEAND